MRYMEISLITRDLFFVFSVVKDVCYFYVIVLLLLCYYYLSCIFMVPPDCCINV